MYSLSKSLFRLTFFIVLMTVVPVSIFCEENNVKDDVIPEPYGEDEFPLWQKDLRRFEIVTLGSLPFVTMLSFWGYDITRSIQHPGDPAYYPWPVKKAGLSVPLTQAEQRNIFFSAVGISIGIGLIDLSYRLIKRDIDKKKLERENLIDDAIQLVPMNSESVKSSSE